MKVSSENSSTKPQKVVGQSSLLNLNHHIMFLPLILLTLISSSGLLLYTFKKIPQNLLNLLIGFGAGSMLAVSLVHILPESLEVTDKSIYAFIGGFLVIYIIEEILTPHHHDHKHGDHAHEDPHEHYDHVALVSWIAIFLHTLLDGLGIRAGFALSSEVGAIVLFGVALHQIPVSLSLAAIFRDSAFHKNIQMLFLCAFAFAAPIGYLISDMIFAHIDATWSGIATALAGGSLLYVATADLLPVIHAQTHKKYLTVIFFIIGCVAMTCIRLFE